jgi:hypothetical protein
MYLIIFLKQVKKKKEDDFSSVEEFHKKYSKYKSTDNDRETTHKYGRNNYNSHNNQSGQSGYKSGYTYKYVTKYNNPEDYREKH